MTNLRKLANFFSRCFIRDVAPLTAAPSKLWEKTHHGSANSRHPKVFVFIIIIILFLPYSALSFVSAATLEFFLLLASEFALILQRSILYSFKCHKRGPRTAGKGRTDMYL